MIWYIIIYYIISWYSDIHGRGPGDEAGICETWSYHSLEGKQVVTQNCRQIQVWGSYPIGRLRPYNIIPYCSSFINQNRRAWIHNAMNNISTCQNKCGFKWAAQIKQHSLHFFALDNLIDALQHHFVRYSPKDLRRFEPNSIAFQEDTDTPHICIILRFFCVK